MDDSSTKQPGPHFNPKFKNQETGEQGVEVGPPEVLKMDGENYVPWGLG